MKLKLPFAFFCLFIFLNARAQIVLTTADFPAIGEQAIYRAINSTSTSPGPSGANQTWNFASLAPGYLDTLFYLNPASTPDGATFPTSTICEKHGDDNYQYYMSTPTGMKLTGFADATEAIPLQIQGYTFPLLTYGSSVAHQFRAKFNVVSANTYDATFIQHNSTADGWGTVTTPTGTVNVLRIFTSEMRYDSSYVSGVGSQTASAVGYYYKWYAKGLGWPVLEISRGAIGEPDFEKTTYATDLSGVTGVVENTKEKVDANIFPNPFNGSFTLETPVAMTNANLIIYDLAGQQVQQHHNLNGTYAVITTGTLQAGVYFYRLNGNNNTAISTGTLMVK